MKTGVGIEVVESENDWIESFFLSLCCIIIIIIIIFIIIILFYNPCNQHQFDGWSSLTCTLDLYSV